MQLLEDRQAGSPGLRGTMRRFASVVLAALLAVPAGPVSSASQGGTITGVTRLEGRPASGVTVAFIDLLSGAVVRATSKEDGTFQAIAPVGEYAVTTESQAGLAVGQAPVRVAVTEGKVATAELDLVAVAAAAEAQEPAGAAAGAARRAQRPPVWPPAAAAQAAPEAAQPPAGPVYAETTGAGAAIQFSPVTCFVAGEFPLLDASIQPLASVARARVYFKSAAGDSYFYVEMTEETGRYFGKLPRPTVAASPITYYIQSTTTDFEESQTREIEAIVVEKSADCGDRVIAAFGPAGAVTVFSAATGASIAPVGFVAAASGLAVGIISLIAAGAAAAGVVGGVVANPSSDRADDAARDRLALADPDPDAAADTDGGPRHADHVGRAEPDQATRKRLERRWRLAVLKLVGKVEYDRSYDYKKERRARDAV